MEKNSEKISARNVSHSDAGGKNKIVETYAEDMAKVLEDDRSGLIKKIIHGEEEHEIERKNLSPESIKNRFFVLIGLLFILFGFTTLFYFILMRDVPTVPIEKQFRSLIFHDTSIFIEVKAFKKEEIVRTVFNGVNTTKVKNGGVEGIYLTYDKKVIGLRKFITLIKSNFILSNINLVDDNFLLGVVNGETKDLFILLKMRSVADIFDSLRAWENKMFLNLYGFFGKDLSPETKYLLTANFTDGVVKNKNARILYGKDGKIVMMYIFANDTSVIITNTENAAQEIMLRLASSRVKK